MSAASASARAERPLLSRAVLSYPRRRGTRAAVEDEDAVVEIVLAGATSDEDAVLVAIVLVGTTSDAIAIVPPAPPIHSSLFMRPFCSSYFYVPFLYFLLFERGGAMAVA